jgi:hypothetical protein
VAEQQQQGHHNPSNAGNLYNLSMADLCNVINTGRDTHNIIIARKQERTAEEDYCSSDYQDHQNYSVSTRKCKLDNLVTAVEHPPQGRKMGITQEHFEKLLHKYCPWHPNSKHSAIECHNLRRALGAPPLIKGNAKLLG